VDKPGPNAARGGYAMKRLCLAQRFTADLAKFAKIVKEAHIPAQD
jgi:hypothetical protein